MTLAVLYSGFVSRCAITLQSFDGGQKSFEVSRGDWDQRSFEVTTSGKILKTLAYISQVGQSWYSTGIIDYNMQQFTMPTIFGVGQRSIEVRETLQAPLFIPTILTNTALGSVSGIVDCFDDVQKMYSSKILFLTIFLKLPLLV